MRVEREQVAGCVQQDGPNTQIICLDCMSEEAIKETTSAEVVTIAQIEREDAEYYCDECGQHMPSAPAATRRCVLCGKAFSEFGNNPAPLAEHGQCCDECNRTKVIPERYRRHTESRS